MTKFLEKIQKNYILNFSDKTTFTYRNDPKTPHVVFSRKNYLNKQWRTLSFDLMLKGKILKSIILLLVVFALTFLHALVCMAFVGLCFSNCTTPIVAELG